MNATNISISDDANGRQRLQWQGSKVPRGAMVGGSPVSWAQHGRLVDKHGYELATYKRVVEFGGSGGNSHEMIIYPLDDPDGLPAGLLDKMPAGLLASMSTPTPAPGESSGSTRGDRGLDPIVRQRSREMGGHD